MSSLCELANYYGSDKGENRTEGKGHNYVKTYEKYFAPLKDKEFSLIEIGVRTGASMWMWQDYFPKAKIYGLDIEPVCQRIEKERIRIIIGNQNNPKDLKTMMDMINDKPLVIIDDGSHSSTDIIASLHFLKDYLPTGGLYFIEDMDPNQQKEMVKVYVQGLTDMELLEYVESEAGNKEELGVLRKL